MCITFEVHLFKVVQLPRVLRGAAVVAGPSGVGKSSLLNALSSQALPEPDGLDCSSCDTGSDSDMGSAASASIAVSFDSSSHGDCSKAAAAVMPPTPLASGPVPVKLHRSVAAACDA